MLDSISPSGSLATSQSKLLTALEAMSSGSSVGSAAANPTAAAQSASYSVQLSSQAQALNNIQDGGSMLDTAGGAVGQIGQSLQDIRTLTVQAGDGSLSASDLQAIQSQIGQLSQGIDQIAGSTQFNGQNLLDGSGNVSLQTGANAGDVQNVSLGSMTSASLGVSGIDVTTAAGQANALTALDTAIQQTNTQQASIGALQNGLGALASNLGTTSLNLAAANSQVSDTDYAKASSDLAQANVQNQVSLRALAMYNAMQSNSLALLPHTSSNA